MVLVCICVFVNGRCNLSTTQHTPSHCKLNTTTQHTPSQHDTTCNATPPHGMPPHTTPRHATAWHANTHAKQSLLSARELILFFNQAPRRGPVAPLLFRITEQQQQQQHHSLA